MLRRRRANRIFLSQSKPFIPKEFVFDASRISRRIPIPVLLTHDVETEKGIKLIDRILEIETNFGVKSTWNFVLDKYGCIGNTVDKLRKFGHECGAHGLYHDGRLFRSKETFRKRMEEIVRLSRMYGLTGFRSPSLLRNEKMLSEMDYFIWDSSIPSWDPFQPQPGGCLQYYPYMLNDNIVELPVTLWQDFTIFTELNELSARIWIDQANEVARIKGLINVIVHPDYFDTTISSSYSAFLDYLLKRHDIEFLLPSSLSDEYRKMINEK